ncbi:hypothetical protein DMJ13_25920 [halophilic archaeon]|nr:hypothetical protein DMJ13_25920 [halophilic archaeon]
MSDAGMANLSVGDRVIDTEDDDPNQAVVVWCPSEKTIADWEFQTSEGMMTTAETNPEYSADAQLVVVSFEDDLNGYWEGWQDVETGDLFEGVRENGVHQYGFPESRLQHADEATETTESDDPGEEETVALPEEFPEIAERLEQSEYDVEYDTSEEVLRVEKHGVEHAVEHDGTVRGESGIKQRVTEIVDRFL